MSFNKNESQYALKWAKKIKAIETLGGKCRICKNDNIFVLEFHHKYDDTKEKTISELKHGRWDKLERELEQCELLCGNCHCELHHRNGRGAIRKIDILDVLSRKSCNRCGYSGENFSSLCFHHTDKNSKKFDLTTAFNKNNYVSMGEILKEIEKCELICINCHRIEHLDVDRFNLFKDKINKKMLTYKLPHKIQDDVIKKMKDSGMGVCQIAKQLGINKSSISYAFNRV